MENGVMYLSNKYLKYYKLFKEDYLSRIYGRTILKDLHVFTLSEERGCKRISAMDARVLYLLMHRDIAAQSAYKSVDVILPDGRPIYWISRLLRRDVVEQVSGPDLFFEVLSDSVLKQRRHVFYGGSEETIVLMKERAQKAGVNLVYAESPPFVSLEALDVSRAQNLIDVYKPDFFWCGLGAPKQEYLLSKLFGDKIVMASVGLAFDYYAGVVKRPPRLISIFGLEWLMRYSQQPKRFGRFIRPLFFCTSLLLAVLIVVLVKGRWYSHRN